MSSCNSVNIYTDGSCINNGKPEAKASIGIWVQDFPEMCVSERLLCYSQTNQIAELRAIERALDIGTKFDKINIFTDSKYAINCITVWCLKWERNGWKSSRGKPPVNMEIIKRIINTVRFMESIGKVISFTYIPGHSGNEGNNAAHDLAMNASRSL